MKKTVALIGALALLLAACGGGSAATSDSGEIQVTLGSGSNGEFSLSPASVTVAAGQTVTFVVSNEGLIEHEFRLTNEHGVEEHLEAGHADHGDEGDDAMEAMEGMLVLAAGATGSLTVTFDASGEHTLMACLLPGHYEAGMVGDIVLDA